jgi:hypothetical protein
MEKWKAVRLTDEAERRFLAWYILNARYGLYGLLENHKKLITDITFHKRFGEDGYSYTLSTLESVSNRPQTFHFVESDYVWDLREIYGNEDE